MAGEFSLELFARIMIYHGDGDLESEISIACG
jgi:hypothetical protein